MRIAAVPRDRVDGLDLLRAHFEEELVGARDDFVLVDPGPKHPVDLLVHGVDEARRLVEQCDLLGRLDLARLEHDLGAVGHLHAGTSERLEREQVGHVDAEWLAGEPVFAELVRDPLAETIRDPRLDGHRSAHRRHSGTEVLRRQPGGEKLVVAGGGAEVPEDRIAAARQQREAGVLVSRPLPDVRARDVADVVRVEEEQRAELGRCERGFGSRKPILAQTREVDALLPVHSPRGVRGSDRSSWPRHGNTA
jgi:hypothetical protein